MTQETSSKAEGKERVDKEVVWMGQNVENDGKGTEQQTEETEGEKYEYRGGKEGKEAPVMESKE